MKTAFFATGAAALLLASCSQGAPVDDAADGNAQAETPVAAETSAQVVARFFESADLNRNGQLTRDEAEAFMTLSLISQDADGDGRLSLAEFQVWDVGFLSVANANGAADRYEAAKAALFQTWDVDGDGYLVEDEYAEAIGAAFASAPKQNDGHMTAEEFANLSFVSTFATAAE